MLIGAGCLIFILVFVPRDFEVGSKQESTASPVQSYFYQFITESDGESVQNRSSFEEVVS